MAQYTRGTYEPPDDLHIFDASEEDDDADGSRLPLLIVISLIVIGAFGGVVWLAYTQGVERGRSDAPRLLAAEQGPVKVAADNKSAGNPYKGLKIYQQPAPADEQADQQTTAPPSRVAPDTTVVTPLAPVQAAPPSVAAQKPVEHAESAKPAAPPPEIRTASPQSTDQGAAAPQALSSTTEAQAPAPMASGQYVLQIGAYKSQAEADAAWKVYQAHHAATLGSYASDVKQVDLGAKGTWFRLRVGSFPTKAAAAALCQKLTAEGGACFPSK